MVLFCPSGVWRCDSHRHADFGISSGGRLGICPIYGSDDPWSYESVGLSQRGGGFRPDPAVSAPVLYQPRSDGVCIWD